MGILTLGNLENHMNAKNTKNNLGKPKGRTRKSRNSLDIMSKSNNSLGRLSVNKPREKGRRRSSLARNLLPKDKG